MSSRLSKYQQLRSRNATSARQVDEKVSRERRNQRESLKRRIDDVTKQISSMNARKEKLKTQLVSIEEQIEKLNEEIADANAYIDDLTRRLQNYLNANFIKNVNARSSRANNLSRPNSSSRRF